MNTTERSSAAAAAQPAKTARCFSPEESASEWWITLLLFGLTCAYLYLFRRYSAMDPDEGIILQGAQRILRGEVLYRDFFSFYTPGSYYFLAALFKIFGNSILVARTVLVFFGGIFSVVNYLLARRVCSRGSALCVAAMVTLTCLPYRFLVLHNWDSTLWACLALYCAVRWMESLRWTWAFATGSLTSLTFLFEQSKGAGLALGMGAGILVVAYLGRQKEMLAKQVLLAAGAGLLWPIALTFGYFTAQHGITQMLADWLWPLQHYTRANRVPYGYQNWSDSARHLLFGSGTVGARLVALLAVTPSLLLPVLPLLAIGLLGYWIVRMRRKQAPPAKCSYYVMLNAALAGLLLSVVLVRADIVHFMYLAPLFYLLFAWLLDGRDIPGRVFRAAKPLLIACFVLAFLSMSAALLLRATVARFTAETRRGVVKLPSPDTVLPSLQAHTTPGETILVHPYLPLYYYLTGTYSPSRYDYLQPGMSTPAQYQETLAQVASKRLRVVLLETSFMDKIPTSWPETPLLAIADDPATDYILGHYHPCQRLQSPAGWRFLLLMRNDLPCP
ncbi:MAG: glycosyltransferase family 39 protein [Acidobacteriia bacterium]|nr:glycosyltransferase family 39 protein [Terriglobia bacterium]